MRIDIILIVMDIFKDFFLEVLYKYCLFCNFCYLVDIFYNWFKFFFLYENIKEVLIFVLIKVYCNWVFYSIDSIVGCKFLFLVRILGLIRYKVKFN